MKKKIICIVMSVLVFFGCIQIAGVSASAKNNGLTVKSSQDSNNDKSGKKSNGLTVKSSQDSGDAETDDRSLDFDDDTGYDSYENDYIELAGDGDTPIFSTDYIAEYAEKHGINLPKQKKKSVIKKIIKDTSNPVYLTQKSSGQYLVTNDTTDLVYYGNTKDNKPNGKGKILKVVCAVEEKYAGHTMLDFSDCDYATAEENIYMVNVYMGEFKNGYYEGYGWKFNIPGPDYLNEGYSRDYGANYVAVTDDVQENIWETCNPITYMGEFKKGKYSGEGIEILYPILSFAAGTTKEELKNTGYEGIDREIVIYSGTYKKDKENGKTKQYIWGKLYYDGNMKKGEYDGKGTLYFSNSDQIKYKGEWSYGKYDGKGTLYEKDGSVKYKGKWKNGDYAH